MAETRIGIQMAKAYDPKSIEPNRYAFWEKSGFFYAEVEPGRPRYCITIPPPNVTGELHMGHALQHTIHDTLVRWKRMLGLNTLCVPGTDHAGIATNRQVEKLLAEEGTNRWQIGREKFLERCWEWTHKYGGTIIQQMKQLGCSYDWRRNRFTLDDHYVKAVLTAFVRLYEQGYIYRGSRVTSWCPHCLTAVSDLEIEYKEIQGYLWYIRYPFTEGSGYLVVATTRPETMLGDTAVAVHPEDERYKDHIGKKVRLPLLGREIPVIADPILVDPLFGTGVVKVTPAHDPNDFEAGQRNRLPTVVVISKEGVMTKEAGPYAGLNRFEARQKVVEDLARQNLLEKVEEYTLSAGHHDRCKTLLEPLLSEQWYVRMRELANLAIQAIESGSVRIIPERFAEPTLEWLRDIKDWCISRQIWWGHRIPVWTCSACHYQFAQVEPPAECPKCGSTSLEQDPDVLDTWFSSALWPFAVLGWPDSTAEMEYFYPTDLLITDRQILRLWVCRMIFMSCFFLKEIPFKEVFVHATVLNPEGRRMSKSLGTGIDPMELIENYGSDATRFGLLLMAAKGQDIRFSEERIETSRYFCNKIWNLTRFVLMNLQGPPSEEIGEPEEWNLEDRWITSRLHRTLRTVNLALEDYRLDDAAQALYSFLWDEFADWYVEIAKPRLQRGGVEAERARRLLLDTLETSLRLLHPFMPFVTEELWQVLKSAVDEEDCWGPAVIVAPYPQPMERMINPEAEAQFEQIMALVRSVRNLRAEAGVQPGQKVEVYLVDPPETVVEHLPFYIEALSRSTPHFTTRQEVPHPALSDLAGKTEVYLPLSELMDLDREMERLRKEMRSLQGELAQVEGKLNNPRFLERAPQEIVDKERRIYEELSDKLRKAQSRLTMLEKAVQNSGPH